jgi:hypothetical protein
MREWAVSRGVWARWFAGGVGGSGGGWCGYGGLLRFPAWGEAVRCLGIHPPRTLRWVVCMERYGLSDCWAQSLMSTRTWWWGHADGRARSGHRARKGSCCRLEAADLTVA